MRKFRKSAPKKFLNVIHVTKIVWFDAKFKAINGSFNHTEFPLLAFPNTSLMSFCLNKVNEMDWSHTFRNNYSKNL